MLIRLYTLFLLVFFSTNLLADYYHADSALGPKPLAGVNSMDIIIFSAMRTAPYSLCEDEICGDTGFMYHKKTRVDAVSPIIDQLKTCVADGANPDFSTCLEGLAYSRSRSAEDFEIGVADFAIAKNKMAIAWVEVEGVSPTTVTYKYSISPATLIRVNNTFMPKHSSNMMFYTNGGGQNPEILYQVSETQYWPEIYPDLWSLRCRKELGLDFEGSGVVWETFCYVMEPIGVVDTIKPNVGTSGVVVGSRYYDSAVLSRETNDGVLPWYSYDQQVTVANCDLEGECAPPPELSWGAPSREFP